MYYSNPDYVSPERRKLLRELEYERRPENYSERGHRPSTPWWLQQEIRRQEFWRGDGSGSYDTWPSAW